MPHLMYRHIPICQSVDRRKSAKRVDAYRGGIKFGEILPAKATSARRLTQQLVMQVAGAVPELVQCRAGQAGN